jgi:Cd2+/Zn2+-exporting ATPase
VLRGRSVQEPTSGDANLVTAKIPAGYTLTRLRIAQMDCPTEEALIRKKLGGMTSVQGLEFNLMQRVLTVVHDNGALPPLKPPSVTWA